MDIIGGISAATEGLKILNELRKIDKDLDKAELKLRLTEIVDKLLDSKQALQEAQEREFALRNELRHLEARLEDTGRLEDQDGLLFRLDDADTRVGEPYCNQCHVKEGKLYRLLYGPYFGGSHKCSNCDGVFGKADRSIGSGVSTEYNPLDY